MSESITYVYEATLRDELAAAAMPEQSHSSAFLRAVTFELISPFDHFNVTDNRVAAAIETAIAAAISRRARQGETCVHRRILSPQAPQRPPTRYRRQGRGNASN